MHLLAESGGTKTQWYLYDAQGLKTQFRTSGFNPNVQSESEIEALQQKELLDQIAGKDVDRVDFYGAGLGASATEAIVRRILERIFPDSEIHVQSDMYAAAKAVAGNEAGIVCILGTGSNCCWWDGEKISANLGSHGYLFNDEGSGADLGRTLLSAIFNDEVPHDVSHLFRDWAKKPMMEIRTEIYHSAKVNSALAEYSRFFAEHLSHPVLSTMVVARFMAFFTRTVFRMNQFQTTPLHFVGSIADVYQNQLNEALGMMKLVPASITAAPGEALFAYHFSELLAHQK